MQNHPQNAAPLNSGPKAKKARLKRKVSALESCIRTDLLEPAPNAGKSVALDKLVDAYQEASTEMLGLLWEAFQAGEPIIAWRLVSKSNPLHGKSVTPQPAEAQIKGTLSSHLGWIQNDASKLISKMDPKLKDLHEKFGIEISRAESAHTKQECFACGAIDSRSRKGAYFKFVACGHAAHADENASDCIGGRHPPGMFGVYPRRDRLFWPGAIRPIST